MKPHLLGIGSFDPFTLKDCSIIREMSESYIMRIGIVMNTKNPSLFSISERFSITKKELKHLGIDSLGIDLIPDSMKTKQKFQDTYSSKAKELIITGGDVRSIVSLAVKEALESRLIRQYPIVLTGSMGAGKSTYAQEIVSYSESKGIPITHIDFDAIAHEIYTSLTEPVYVNVRNSIRKAFGLPDSSDGWIDRKTLRTHLQIDPTDKKSPLDTEKRRRLDELLADAMLSRYREKIHGVQGIILLDGATILDNKLSHFANNNVLLIDASEEIRLERVMKRYMEKWDNVEPSVIQSFFAQQSSIHKKTIILDGDIKTDWNGSMTLLQNNSSSRDIRKTFFQILNQIDRFGDLRTSLIFTFLEMNGDYNLMTRELRRIYDVSWIYPHTWEYIIDCIQKLFEIAIAEDLSDDEIGTIGWMIIWHDEVYKVKAKRNQKNDTSHKVDLVRCKKIIQLIRETVQNSWKF